MVLKQAQQYPEVALEDERTAAECYVDYSEQGSLIRHET